MINHFNFELEARNYRHSVEEFVERYSLPPHWFAVQDHLAFKAFNQDDFGFLIKYFKPRSSLITEVVKDQRYIAAAHLLGKFSLDMSLVSSDKKSKTEWVEIMLARPDDQSNSPVLLDHEEIYFERGIIPIRTVLRGRGLGVFDQENDAHSWISVIMNDYGEEIKFTDRQLSDIVREDLETGRGVILHRLAKN